MSILGGYLESWGIGGWEVAIAMALLEVVTCFGK